MTDPILTFALIGALGIGSQWLAWRLRLPAIVLMLAAGLAAGPGFGVLAPAQVMGDLFRPVVAVAVAVILFEGGLTLNMRELRESGSAVRRMVLLGAPLGWAFAYLALRYGAGLSAETSAVFGGILIVTGPTVVIPLLRQARLASRPARVLRWEAIVNDPVGALAAVLALEVVAVLHGAGSAGAAGVHLAQGIAVAVAAGLAAGYGVAWAFRNGRVPEYMKVPVLFGSVLAIYALTDTMLHESGLLAVTIMGVVIGNAHLRSFSELRRFKEHATVILVSGVFIMLAASLEREMITGLDWRALLAVALIVFVARPAAVLASLAWSDLPVRERALIAWIGPRGVVAVAVSGLFGARLVDMGLADGAVLAPMAFAIVAATVILHGFSIGPLARALALTSTSPPGVLIVGATAWTTALASELSEADIPVTIADRNYVSLRAARLSGIDVFHGEILSEAAEDSLAMSHYGVLIAATYNDDYNALICTDFGPEFGRHNVYQIGRHTVGEGETELRTTLGGQQLALGTPYDDFARRFSGGWTFVRTGLTDAYGMDAYLADREEVEVLAVIAASGTITFATGGRLPAAKAGDTILAMTRRADQGK